MCNVWNQWSYGPIIVIESPFHTINDVVDRVLSGPRRDWRWPARGKGRTTRHDHTAENYRHAQAWLQRWDFNDPRQIRVPVRVYSASSFDQQFQLDVPAHQPLTQIRARADEILP
jgi:hypothetical protein